MDRLRRLLKPGIILPTILILGFVFFAHNAHLQLASDDIGWLQGQTPTVFDEYRVIPRLLFTALYRGIGPNVIAILAMIFFFHSMNTVLVYSLAASFLRNPVAAGVASYIFMINPITLSTLTWISCFSYVLGTTFALFALFLFSKGMTSQRKWVWWTGCILCYGTGLFCSHELLFLPVLFFLLNWLEGTDWLKPAGLLFGITMLLGLLVNFLFYRFDRYGVDTGQLFNLGFIAAFASSALSFGLTLLLAYPLSFFVSPISFLRIAFSEPVRWGLTLALLTAGLTLYRPNKRARIWLVLVLSFVALVTPYIIRFYLMPSGVNYDISYVLSGRVFYLPFAILALVGGALISELSASRFIKSHPFGWLLILAAIGVYLYALLVLYSPKDFMGLSVLQGENQSFPVPWNPYRGNHVVWLASFTLIIVIAGIRIIIYHREQSK